VDCLSPHADSGHSLIEMLIVLAISGMVLGGVLTMTGNIQTSTRDLGEIVDARQSARISLDQLQRDMMVTGVGLTWIAPPFPLVVPREDGGVDLRSNPGAIDAALASDMKGKTRLDLDGVAGFSVGDQIAVYDDTGDLDLAEITGISGTTVSVEPSLSKSYVTADGTAVLRVETISYYARDASGSAELVREASGSANAVTQSVVSFQTSYLDEDGNVFEPTTEVSMLRIRTVEITLTVRTDVQRLEPADRPEFTVTTRITPRAIALAAF